MDFSYGQMYQLLHQKTLACWQHYNKWFAVKLNTKQMPLQSQYAKIPRESNLNIFSANKSSRFTSPGQTFNMNTFKSRFKNSFSVRKILQINYKRDTLKTMQL